MEPRHLSSTPAGVAALTSFDTSGTSTSNHKRALQNFFFFFLASQGSLQVMETGTKLGPAPESLFRPVKRRKFLRRRPDHEREDSQEDAQGINDESASTHTPQETDDTVRVRRPQRTRKGGIEFSTTSRQATDNANQAVATPPTAEEAEDERVRAMCDRFTAHTGQTVDIDKHMYGPLPLQVLFLMRVSKWKTNKIRMNYIETEMAKRHRREMPVDTSDLKNPNRNEAVSGGPSTTDSNFARREPATLGKLHEIDLGQETKLRNIARTEAATRRLAGDDTAPVEEETATEKTAVEKEGKPWRNRKSQNSKDVERDRLVEEVLRESKRESSVSLNPHIVIPTANIYNQWTYMMNRTMSRRSMTRQRTIGLPSNSGGISWMRFSLVGGWHEILRTTTLRRPKPRRLEDQNWGAAGAHEQRCGSHRKPRNELSGVRLLRVCEPVGTLVCVQRRYPFPGVTFRGHRS